MRRVSERCSGCASCLAMCPKGAIEFHPNDEGFYCAVKNDLCIECGICERHCSSIVSRATPLSTAKTFVATARDREEVKGSSSGGIGYLLAKKAIETGGVAFGCEYDSRIPGARHILVRSKEELCKIQGSLYLMSDFSGLAECLCKTEKGVLFGTPCQIAGAHAVLESMGRRSSYLLVDIFCHGVPSQLAWVRHLNYLAKQEDGIKSATFKFRNGKHFILSAQYITCESGELIYFSRPCGQDGFYRLYLEGSMFNQACYECPFRRSSCADIRIGDIAVGDYRKLENPPSCVIVNSDFGSRAFETISDEVDIKKIDYSRVDRIQDKGDRPVPKKRGNVINALKRGKAPDEIERLPIALSHIKGKAKSVCMQLKGGRFGACFPRSIFDVEE